MKRKSKRRKEGTLAIILLIGLSLIIFHDYWASPGHWWFGGSNYSLKINDIPQGDYAIYRALNGDVLVICWDHMTEYYASVSEQKVWEINRRQEVSFDGHFLLYFRHSLASLVGAFH